MYSEMLFEFGPMEKSPQSGHTSASIEGTARRLRQFRCTYPSCSSTRTNKRNNIERHVWTQHVRHKLQMNEVKYFARYYKHHVDPFVSEVKDGRLRQRGRRTRTDASSDPYGRGSTKSTTPDVDQDDTADDDDNGDCGSDVDSADGDEVMTDHSRCSTPTTSLIASPFPRTVSAPANVPWAVNNSHGDLQSTMVESDSGWSATQNLNCTRQRSATLGPDHTIPSRSYGGGEYYHNSSSSTDAGERPLPTSPLVPHSRQTPPMRYYGHRPDSGFPEVKVEATGSLKAASSLSPQHGAGSRSHATTPTLSRRTGRIYQDSTPLPPVGSSLIPIAQPPSTTPVEQHDESVAAAWTPPSSHTSPFYGPLGPLLFALQSIDAAEAAQRMQQPEARGVLAKHNENSALLGGAGASAEPHQPGKWCADECVWRPWERIPAAGAAPRL